MFTDKRDLHVPPAYRLFDLTAEVGAVAAATASSGHSTDPKALSGARDGSGDVLFATFAPAGSPAADTVISAAPYGRQRRLPDRLHRVSH